MYTPSFVCHFKSNKYLAYGIFFFKKLCPNNFKSNICISVCQLCIINVISIDFTINTSKYKLMRKVSKFWRTFDFLKNITFVGLFSQFHDLSQVFLFEMLDFHLGHLKSEKKNPHLFLNRLFFLSRTFIICIPPYLS